MKSSKQVINEKNKIFWSIVKGIGILSIVLGHTCYFAPRYVYLYHLVIFFFVSGYLYSEKKYGDDPYLNFMSRVKSSWKKYLIFCIVFILLHNIFLDIGIIINKPKYNTTTTIINILNSIVFSSSEQMAGALWFIPILIVSSSIFGTIIYYGRKSKKITGNKIIKDILIILLTIAIGILGLALNMKNMYLAYHLQTAFLVVPIFTIAYYVRNKIKDLNKILKWYIFIPCIILLYTYVNYFNWSIELSINQIQGEIEFYIISITGIYACLYIAKIIMNIKYIKDYFGLIGKYSFEIMAGHFFIAKLIDVGYAQIIGETNKLVYGVFPTAYSRECWILYAILGTLIPALLGLLIKNINNTISKKLKLIHKK